MKIANLLITTILFFTVACESKGQTYDFVDEMPSYKDGERAMNDHIWNNFKLPKKFDPQKHYEYQEKAIIGFIVDKDGSLDSLKIVKTTNVPIIDSLYIDIFNSMGKWIPGKLDGKIVRVRMKVSIRTRINL